MRPVLICLLLLMAAPAFGGTDPDIAAAERIAHTGQRRDAIARLRGALGRTDTPERRCVLGVWYADTADLPRAHLYLSACSRAGDPGLRQRGEVLLRKVAKQLAATELSPIEVVTQPVGARVEIDALPGDWFMAPQQVWVGAGRHRIKATGSAGAAATSEVTVADGNRALVQLDLQAAAPPTAGAGRIDFSADGAPAPVHAGPPPPVKHDSLLPAKYRKGLGRGQRGSPGRR